MYELQKAVWRFSCEYYFCNPLNQSEKFHFVDGNELFRSIKHNAWAENNGSTQNTLTDRNASI